LPKYNVFDPLQALTTPYRAQRAMEGGQAAAFILAGLNLLTALLVYFHRTPAHTLIAAGRVGIASAHLCAAVLATGLGVFIARRRAAWACWCVLGWSVCELFPWLTGPLYGHAGVYPMPVLALICAIQGVRGARAQQRLARATPTAEPPAATP
jgi:hypothetical protein